MVVYFHNSSTPDDIVVNEKSDNADQIVTNVYLVRSLNSTFEKILANSKLGADYLYF